MTSLRDLCQAAVDDPSQANLDAARRALAALSVRSALAAITEAEERGYARAMGEVVERCEATVRDYVDGRRWDTRIMGMCDEAENIAEWASEQAGD